MSISTHVIGIKPPDDKWRKMKAVWDACNDAGTDAPGAVYAFFEDEEPNDLGVEVKIAAERYSGEACDGYTVDITKLPPDVKFIRFINSY